MLNLLVHGASGWLFSNSRIFKFSNCFPRRVNLLNVVQCLGSESRPGPMHALASELLPVRQRPRSYQQHVALNSECPSPSSPSAAPAGKGNSSSSSTFSPASHSTAAAAAAGKRGEDEMEPLLQVQQQHGVAPGAPASTNSSRHHGHASKGEVPTASRCGIRPCAVQCTCTVCTAGALCTLWHVHGRVVAPHRHSDMGYAGFYKSLFA